MEIMKPFEKVFNQIETEVIDLSYSISLNKDNSKATLLESLI